jgi:hypothetical protein
MAAKRVFYLHYNLNFLRVEPPINHTLHALEWSAPFQPRVIVTDIIHPEDEPFRVCNAHKSRKEKNNAECHSDNRPYLSSSGSMGVSNPQLKLLKRTYAYHYNNPGTGRGIRAIVDLLYFFPCCFC